MTIRSPSRRTRIRPTGLPPRETPQSILSMAVRKPSFEYHFLGPPRRCCMFAPTAGRSTARRRRGRGSCPNLGIVVRRCPSDQTMWGYDVSMVNSYVCYKRYCELKGVPVQWNHHDWNEAIGYATSTRTKIVQGRSLLQKLQRVQPPLTPKKRAPKIDNNALSPTRVR